MAHLKKIHFRFRFAFRQLDRLRSATAPAGHGNSPDLISGNRQLLHQRRSTAIGRRGVTAASSDVGQRLDAVHRAVVVVGKLWKICDYAREWNLAIFRVLITILQNCEPTYANCLC